MGFCFVLLMFLFPWSLFLPGFLVLMPWGSSDQEIFRSRRVSLLRVLWLLCLLRFWVSTLLLGSLDTASKKKQRTSAQLWKGIWSQVMGCILQLFKILEGELVSLEWNVTWGAWSWSRFLFIISANIHVNQRVCRNYCV